MGSLPPHTMRLAVAALRLHLFRGLDTCSSSLRFFSASLALLLLFFILLWYFLDPSRFFTHGDPLLASFLCIVLILFSLFSSIG